MGVLLQCFAAAASSCGSLVMGLLSSWPSYTLELYTSQNTSLLSAPMTEMEGSLVGSMPSLGAMLGTAVAGLVLDKIGRQKGGVMLSLPFIISWLLIGNTSSSTVILAARFIGGISGGASLVFAPLFISETAQDSIRGALASGPIVFYCSGSLISYLSGWFFTYKVIIWMNIALSVLNTVLCFLVVESPLYLLRENREEDARQAISRYRGASPASKIVLEELSRLKLQIMPAVELVDVKDNKDNEQKPEEAEKEKLQSENEKLNSDDAAETEAVETKMSKIKLLFVSPAAKRAFGVVATALSMQVFMGMVPVLVYAKKLFAHAAPNLSSHLCSVLLAIVLTSGSLVTAFIADRAGRRVLIITSSVLVGLCMVVLGLLLQTQLGPAVLPAIVILVYCFCFNLGAGTVPYVLLAEVFTPEVQGLASMLLVQWVWFLNFAIIAIFPIATRLLGNHGVFYIFGAVGFGNAAISFFRVPETKGLSNELIQEEFLRRRK